MYTGCHQITFKVNHYLTIDTYILTQVHLKYLLFDFGLAVCWFWLNIEL